MSEVLQTQRNLEELVKLLRIYFKLDEIVDFAINELDDDEIVVEISAVKDRVRKVIEKLISLNFY
ncbi:hypothetical protein [Saccharolobus islandicus]|uniref:Uncharacterized protein n=1 Tax=Saccharolobus islandicus (strain L.D.8.5 / Lassen \|nr:hypothetical protein [Sulfolobus islandicus]ADB87228.1 conserved hypothetical protein [Sulfolobus islandicus L.D.8.5]